VRNLSLILFILILSSCSSVPDRNPARVESGSCLELASHLVPRKRVPFESEEAFDIRSQFSITRQEIDELYQNKLFKKQIFEKEDVELHERSALILSIIKKNRPDFDEKRVLMRYKRLFKMCEG